jgi:hypothetical protein
MVGATALALNLVTAAGRISHANSVTLTSGGSTVFAIGPAVALVGSLVVMGGAVTALALFSPSTSYVPSSDGGHGVRLR